MQDVGQHRAFGRMLATSSGCKKRMTSKTYHDSLAFVLDNVARPAHFIASAQTNELEFV